MVTGWCKTQESASSWLKVYSGRSYQKYVWLTEWLSHTDSHTLLQIVAYHISNNTHIQSSEKVDNFVLNTEKNSQCSFSWKEKPESASHQSLATLLFIYFSLIQTRDGCHPLHLQSMVRDQLTAWTKTEGQPQNSAQPASVLPVTVLSDIRFSSKTSV